MLHEQVRQARLEHGLSQVKLARLARVPRTQLRRFENGEGITLSTLLKIVAQLPSLERLSIGPVELQLRNVDLEGLRGTLTELITVAAGVLAVLQSASPRVGPPRVSAAGARQQLAEEINAIAAALARGA